MINFNRKSIEFAANGPLHIGNCPWFAVQSLLIWDRIAFVRNLKKSKAIAGRKGLPLTEETLTEDLLFDFFRTQWGRGGSSDVAIWQAQSEPHEGNDLDLWIQYPFGVVRFMVQAKILNMFRKYRSIRHFNSNGEQIDLLRRASTVNKAIPLYLFYNHVDEFVRQETWCGKDCDETQYGCTIAHADLIAQRFYPSGTWTIPTFSDLHAAGGATQLAAPWITLVCGCIGSRGDLARQLLTATAEDDAIPLVKGGLPYGESFQLRAATIEGQEGAPVIYKELTPENWQNTKRDRNPDPKQYYPRFILTIKMSG